MLAVPAARAARMRSSDESGSGDGGDDGRADGGAVQAAQPLRVVGPGRRRSDSRRARQGHLLLDPGRQALHRLQQPVDVRQRRPRPPGDHQGDPGPGGVARLHQPVHGQRGPGPARRQARRDHARRHGRVLLHQRRRRGQRERHPHRPRGHRPPQDPGPLPLVPRRHRRQPDAHRRSAPLGGRAGHSRRGPRARPVSRHGARLGHGRAVAALPRRGDRARGPEAHRRLHPRDDQRHQRHPRAARRLPAGRAGAVRQARHPDDLRRGDGRLRPHRHVVRRRSLERRPRPDDHGQGPDQRLRGARRRRHAAAASPTTSGRRPSTAGSPTTATRSAAPPRWPPSRSTKTRG